MSVVTPGILPRERLLDLIDSPTLAPITLVTAPAGYGKSTLVHQWAARHAPHPCGWYQIRTEHNTLATFLLHLWHAIDDAASPLPPPDPLTIDRVLDRLHACTDQTVLILDDYHLIENGLIHQVTEQLVRNLPPATHLFLLSRQLPDIALARLRAYGQVRQLAQDDLAFTFAEVKQVFAGFPLDDALLAQLTQKSEGWIAGLQLMLMSVNLTTSPAAEQLDRLIATMPENRLLNEYIVEEVLDALPDDLRRFVLDTVVLDVLDPHLCDAVLQLDTSDRFLERLENAIVFVGRPGGVGRPLSYHGLFAECVQRLRLRSGIQPSATELRLRASRWYRSRGQSVEATKYALAAGAWGEASETMSEFLHFDRAQGDVWDTIYWVSKLPTSTMKKDVRLLQSYITAILATGRIDEARTLIESFLHIPGFEPTAIQESWHANQRAFVAYVDGDGDEALYQSYRALSRLPWEDASSRLLAWTGIYRELSDRGERELAREALRQAESDHIRQGGASIYWHFLLAPAIANDAAIRGELARAEALNQQFIRTNPSRMQISSLAFDIKLLSIYVEQNRLDLARDKVDGILTDVDESTRIILKPMALQAVASYATAIGDLERARQTLERGQDLARQIGSRELIRAAEAAFAYSWLQTGQIERAQRWADGNPPASQLVRTFGDVEPTGLHARLLMHQDRLDEAMALLEQGIGRACARGNVWAELSLTVCGASIAQTAGARDDSDAFLKRALELGAPGRFVRVYSSAGVDLRDAIRALLPALSPVARDHARSLVGGLLSNDQTSPLPLTQRERDVLAKLVLGRSNREIAESLFISERTVKKHLANLFRKTGTPNRIALALWGREHMPTIPK